MKKIRYYILALGFALSFSACQDWLTIYPNNEQTSDQYWRNKEEVQAVLSAGYVNLRTTAESMLVWGEARGNGAVTQYSGYAGPVVSQMAVADILPTNTFCNWANFYKVINMANSVIEYGPGVVEKDMSFNVNVMNSYLAEAYFLRALSYFYLVRTFRDVPFVLEPYVTDKQSYFIPKTSGKEIISYLLTDLENKALPYAKKTFSDEDPLNPMNTKGRATKIAIKTLMADMYLWIGEYQKASDACDEILRPVTGYAAEAGVVLTKATSLTGVIDPVDRKTVWFRNFAPADGVNSLGGNSPESIFEVQYSYAKGQTNSYLTWFNTNIRFGLSTYAYSLFYYSELEGDVRGANATYDASTGIKFWKYIGASATTARNTTNQIDQNWIIYRLAEVYLMKAEALTMLSAPASYADIFTNWVEPIRERAGLLPLVTVPSTEAGMLRAILKERNLEFAAEGKNWFDLVRVGSSKDFAHKDILIESIRLRDGGSAGTSAITASRLSDPDSWYMPISESELDNNKLLEQNPYYQHLGN